MKRILLFILLLIFALFFTNTIYACSPAPQMVFLICNVETSIFQQDTTCLNENCSVNVSKNQYGELYLSLEDSKIGIFINERNVISFVGFYMQEDSLVYSQTLSYINSICVEELEDLKPIFTQEINDWFSSKKIFLDRNLVFEPYSSERESELFQSKKAYGKCHYQDYKRVGDWFVVKGETRDYCYLSYGGATLCPRITLSHIQFIKFLFNNPSIHTLPYIIGYLALLILSLGFLIYLAKRKELLLFFKPNKFNGIFTLSLGIPTLLLSLLMVVTLKNTIGLILTYYFLSSLIRYIYMRINKK